MKQEHVEWSKNLFKTLTEGGAWGVPRSGLLFQRRQEHLILVSRMPWKDGIGMSAEQLRQYQKADYQVIAKHMASAGITVLDETGVMSEIISA